MRDKFKKITKEMMGLRGWSLEIEDDKKWYLSKFSDEENDNEYRFYFFIKEDGLHIVRRVKIVRYRHKEAIKTNDYHYITAKKILDTYWDLYKNIHLKNIHIYQ